MFILCFPY